jgi:hypothetical protein
MSPFIFDADLHTVSAHVRDIRAGLLTDQVDASWEEKRGDESAELTLRALAADRAGDASALALIFERAAEIDAGQPFGPRLVEQLAALVSGTAAA